ncbi:hypothetical protein Pmar_PMAR027427, partial [Perkinsus marinus ATCC 50983]
LASSTSHESIPRSSTPSVVPADSPVRGGSDRYNLRKRVSKTPTGMEDSAFG